MYLRANRKKTMVILMVCLIKATLMDNILGCAEAHRRGETSVTLNSFIERHDCRVMMNSFNCSSFAPFQTIVYWCKNLSPPMFSTVQCAKVCMDPITKKILIGPGIEVYKPIAIEMMRRFDSALSPRPLSVPIAVTCICAKDMADSVIGYSKKRLRKDKIIINCLNEE
ncbi:uncharacterized protein LOC120348441 [Styela clava]|uniref:uncharacterized protein LOC120348441 n=1 Tax=Styela clava TaxID=7725 RepID=UPI00193A4632|nr:uncharacterized protein LOC120348441 [Styela clava]